MNKSKISSKLDLEKLNTRFRAARRYSFVAFLLVVVCIYGFVLLRITNLSNVEPSDDAVNSQVNAASVPKIDQSVVNQLKSLQDNSVNVQSLFEQARTSPFQE